MRPEKKLTVGIWLEVPPGAKLVGEGIYQLTMNLVRHSVESAGTRWVFAAPPWVNESLRDLLDDQHIPSDSYDLISANRPTPLLIHMRNWVLRSNRSERRKRTWGISNFINEQLLHSFVPRILAPLLSTANPVVLALLALFPVALAVAAAVFLPIGTIVLTTAIALLALGFAAVCIFLAKRFANFCVRSVLEHLRGESSYDESKVENGSRWTAMSHSVSCFVKAKLKRLGSIGMGTFRVVAIHEYQRLAKLASQRDDVDVWYVPHPGYHFACLINRPMVVAAPDLVFVDFPTSFVGQGYVQATKNIRKLITHADIVISYSDYVRREHVVRHLGREAAATRVIPHAPILLDDRLQHAAGAPGGIREAAKRTARRFVRENVAASVWSATIPQRYLADFPFDETPFLFVSSQIRFHKNCVNLISAFEMILRKRHRNLKMVITGNLGRDDTGLRKHIIAKQLELDILSIPRMPNDVHAAFYSLASLTVVPTLFEGGFPFPFSESLSVGTPVVMSSIPVTQEIVPADLARLMLFEPYDVEAIADTIEWGLDHRDELLAKQQTLYRDLKNRNWNDVASEYLEAFAQAAAQGEERDVTNPRRLSHAA